MHIVFVTIDFIDDNGPTTGLPKYLLRVSKSLIDMGHKVSVITCSNRTVDYEIYGINVYRVRRLIIKKYNDQKKNAIALSIRDGSILSDRLTKLAAKERIDIVQYTSLFGLAYFHNISVPAVTRLSSYARMVTFAGGEDEKEGRAEMEIAAIQKSDAVFGPSYVVAKRVSDDTGVNVDVIESPFLLDDKKEDFAVFDEYYKGKKYLLFYGTLIEYKGLCEIADAAHTILEKYQDLYIGIIGDGDYNLVSLIKKNAGEYSDRIIYNTAMGFAQLRPIISNAMAVMLPSLTENLSNACIECMALGQIVIGTRGASFDQLIDDEKSGFLCEIGDCVSLIEAVHKVMALSSGKRKFIQDNAKKRAAMLSPDIVVKQLLEYYDKVISEYKGNNTSRKI